MTNKSARRPFYAEYVWAFDLLIDRPVRKECAVIASWLVERGVLPGAARELISPAIEEGPVDSHVSDPVVPVDRRETWADVVAGLDGAVRSYVELFYALA